jgi:hypothetical protein
MSFEPAENTRQEDPSNLGSSLVLRQIALSINDTAEGTALIELDKDNLPKRIELFQRDNKNLSKAFEITIEEPLLRRFFNLEDLQSPENVSTLVSIRAMLNAAISYARSKGLVYPTEIREQEKSSLCCITVRDTDETVSYKSSHIPISIEEWTYGHKRHQVTTERRDESGNLLCELRTKSLEYPDGSMVLDVTIFSHLHEHKSHAPHHFVLSARGLNALSLLSLQLESLHTDILELSVNAFLSAYFASTTSEEDKAHGNRGAQPSLVKTDSSPHAQESRKDNHAHTKSINEKKCGAFTLSSGTVVAWDYRDNRDLLTIYPRPKNQKEYLNFSKVNYLGDTIKFPQIIADLADENTQARASVVRKLTGPSYIFEHYCLNTDRSSDCLTEYLLNETDIKRLKILPPERHTALRMHDKLNAALDSMEWVGYERSDISTKNQDAYLQMPYQIFFRAWQGACDKIVLTCRDLRIDNIEITSRHGALFSGSIPEMRAQIIKALQIFTDNPFKLLEHYSHLPVDFSKVLSRPISSTFLRRLSFFSDIMIEDNALSHRLSSPPILQPNLLYAVTQNPHLEITTKYTNNYRMHFGFRHDKLEKVTVAKKLPFFQSFFHVNADQIIFEQHLPKHQHLSPNETYLLMHDLSEVISYHSYDKRNKQPTESLFNALKSCFSFIESSEKAASTFELSDAKKSFNNPLSLQ